MKRLNQIGTTLLVLTVIASGLAQTQAKADSIVQITAEVQGLEQVSSDAWTPVGTYWEAMPGATTFAPLPGPMFNPTFPVYAIADGQYLVDGSGGQLPPGDTVSAMEVVSNAVVNLINQVQGAQIAQSMRAMGMDVPGPPGFGDGGGGGYDYLTNYGSLYTYNTNLLWLQITNVADGIVYANLHNATDEVYAIWSTTNLLTPWQVETEVWPTDTNCMPFNFPTFGRQDLFLRAEDWTGVDSNGDGIPDWWIFYWFGNLNETASDNPYLGYDYTYGYNPNAINFVILLTNNYVNTLTIPAQLNIQSGKPSYVAVLVNDTNTADAVWQPYTSSNIVAAVGPANGDYNIYVGLRGSLVSTAEFWQMAPRITLFNTAPQLILTSPTSGTVSQATVQLQGYAKGPLNRLTYDITNAAGVLTNQAGFLTGQAYSTNYFECSGVMLASGTNRITFHATDWVGNATNLSFTLNYSPSTNAPIFSLVWPLNGTPISGSSFTLQAQVSDPAVSVSASVNGNIVSGLVEQSGTVWVQNLPLAAGTNAVTLTASNSFGAFTTTNFNVVGNDVGLVINPLRSDQLNRASVTNTGWIGDPTNDSVVVNGIEATVNNDGSWEADHVPVSPTGTATLHVQVYVDDPTLIAEQNFNQPQPPLVVLAGYSGSQYEQSYDGTGWGSWTFNWAYDSGGTADFSGYDQGNSEGTQNESANHPLAADGPGFSLPDLSANYFNGDGAALIWDFFSVSFPEWDGAEYYAFFRRSSASQLMVAGTGMQPAGTTNVYLVLASASEYSTPLKYLGQPTYRGDLPLPPEWGALNGQAMQSSGLTNALGHHLGAGLLMVGTATNIIVPYSITQFYTNQAASIDTLMLTNVINIVDANTGSNLTAGVNTVIVGQQMNLRCQVNATNLTATNFQWTVPGYTLTNWYASGGIYNEGIFYPTNGYALPLTATNSQGINFVWTDGTTNAGNASNLVVTCSATVGGVPITAQATFNVLKPMVKITTQTSAVNLGYSVSSGGAVYSLCFGTNPIPGILFMPTYTMPPGTNYDYGNNGAGFEWVQIISDYKLGSYYISGTPPDILEITNEFVVDGPGSYGFNAPTVPWPGTDDSPSVPATTGVLSGVSVSLSATMWLMFEPDHGQLVPIRSVPWHFSGSATNNGSGWVLTSRNWSTNPPDFDAGKLYPTWTNCMASWGIFAQ